MNFIHLFPLAGLITAGCAFVLWRSVWSSGKTSPNTLAMVLAASMLITLYALIRLEPITDWGLDFRFTAAVSICVLIVQYLYFLGLLRHGIHGLGLFLLPATAIPLLIIPLLSDDPILRVHVSSMMEASHLLLSLLAYAILTLAMLHAVMHLMLDRALKRKKIGPIINAMPSLTEVENHMYAQVGSAALILALGILSGLIWQWEELGHFSLLSHKVILSTFSWAALVALLGMRRKSGWQGKRSGWMVIAAYVLLLLAYFGVRMVQSLLN
ncbi:MAG: cytochrome c biogenesis protein CcsA [Mariprofundaceae bacterium]|nr:cytochrome c biogenesis protein CcsA [Mariprofundaceae bacterium]